VNNVETVRRVYDLFSTGDLEEIPDLATEDFTWEYCGPPELPWAGTYVGRSGIDRFFGIVQDLIEVEHLEPTEFINGGERVVALGISRARVLATGVLESYDAEFQGKTFSITIYPAGEDAVISSALDITGRKQAEVALRESEQRFRELANKGDVPGIVKASW